MKFTIKTVLASMVLGAGFMFTSCNNAEPDIDDRDSHIECTLTVGGQMSFGETGYSSDNKFVGEVVDNLTLATGEYGFRALHVGDCVVKNGNRTYHFVVTSSNNTIEPVLDWGISQEELIEELGESSCTVEGNNVVFKPASSKPVAHYTYTFSGDKLEKVELDYVFDSTNTAELLEGYMSDRFLSTSSEETVTTPDGDQQTVTKTTYFNALTQGEATTIATSVEEEVEGSIPGTMDAAMKIVFYSAAAFNK